MTAAAHTSAALEARYGRSPAKRKRDRWIYIGGALVVAVVIVAWVIWAGLDQANGNLDAEDIGHTIVNDRTVSVSYQLSMPTGSTASCALEVENEAHAIVGWKVVDVPASEQFTTGYTDVVHSSELGVTGLIYRCWLT